MTRPAPASCIPSRSKPQELKLMLKTQQDVMCADYRRTGNARALLHARSHKVDAVLRALWNECALPDAYALCAVGGYGRGELFPASDVDILILVPQPAVDAAATAIEKFLGLLWDIGLEIGHSVRTAAECASEAANDITVQTALLEARFLSGEKQRFSEFVQACRADFDPLAFFRAKRLEQEERYARFNDTPYSLEPNCKESPGGLRDLHILMWTCRAAGLGQTWQELVRNKVLSAEDARQIARAENFLRHVRIRLHLLAQRREEKLLFEHQEALAAAFGIARTAAKRASEIMMQRYYKNAKLVTQLNTIVLQELTVRLQPQPQQTTRVLNERFQVENEYLDIRDETVFAREPAAMLEAFLLLEAHGDLKEMTARTLKALWRSRRLIDAGFRREPQHRRLFLQIFQQKYMVRELRRMNQFDILAQYLPAWGRIVGQMQHDLFHVYTVDQHILQVVRNVRRFALPEFAHEYPLCSRLANAFERYWLVYVAAMFHDIAKGRGGDHSQKGMSDARRFCRAHFIGAEDTELVVFLVQHHLTMSSIAQKQDLSNPAVIRAFADLVANERRLVALYLLTVADIRGTSPKVWNSWKGQLLEELFQETLLLLQGGQSSNSAGIEQRQEEARRDLRFHGLRPHVEDALWQELDTVYFLRHGAEEIAWHARSLYHRPTPDKSVVKARLNGSGDGLQVMVYTRDKPELFARLCGFFAGLDFSIVDAKVHTTRHGYALDSFIVLASAGNLAYRDIIALVEHDLGALLDAEQSPPPPARGRLSREVRHFPITPEVSIRPDDRGKHYTMSLTAADRPGLLFAVATLLAQHEIVLHTAKIATLGERVEDSFLISGDALGQTARLVKLEQELLATVQT